MSFFWNPSEAASQLRKVREEATPPADFDLIRAAVKIGLHNLEILASGEDIGTH